LPIPVRAARRRRSPPRARILRAVAGPIAGGELGRPARPAAREAAGRRR
jgi:hypothetical protein